MPFFRININITRRPHVIFAMVPYSMNKMTKTELFGCWCTPLCFLVYLFILTDIINFRSVTLPAYVGLRRNAKNIFSYRQLQNSYFPNLVCTCEKWFVLVLFSLLSPFMGRVRVVVLLWLWRLVGYNGNICKTRSLPGPVRGENSIVFALPSYKGPTATIRAEPSVWG